MEQYFASQKDNIFRNVEVLIYVFDVESRELDNDMHYYQSCLEAIYKVNNNKNNGENFFFVKFNYFYRIRRRQRSFVSCTKWTWWPKISESKFSKSVKMI